jgi:hypothetical protein
MTLPNESAFPLPKHPPSRQDEKRECLGLWKQEPLETWAQFEERVVQEVMQAWEASQQKSRPDRSQTCRVRPQTVT